MAQWTFEIHLIGIAASYLGGGQIAGLDGIVNYTVNRTFADPNFLTDLREPNVVIVGNADHDMAVIGQEGPTRDARTRCGHWSGVTTPKG